MAEGRVVLGKQTKITLGLLLTAVGVTIAVCRFAGIGPSQGAAVTKPTGEVPRVAMPTEEARLQALELIAARQDERWVRQDERWGLVQKDLEIIKKEIQELIRK